jgi:hypothetical protein
VFVTAEQTKYYQFGMLSRAKRKSLGLESLDSFNPRGDKVSYVSLATQLGSPLHEATGLHCYLADHHRPSPAQRHSILPRHEQ